MFYITQEYKRMQVVGLSTSAKEVKHMIIIDDFIIEPDYIDYKVNIRKFTEDGKEYKKLLGYYKNIESSIKAIRNFVIHEKMEQVDIDGLEGTVKAIENINKEFELKLLRVVDALNADTGK